MAVESSSVRDPIKVYDARWEASEFSDAEVRRLFEATLLYGYELGCRAVTFGRDARLAAGRVMAIGVEAALCAGFEVIVNPSPISTPQSYFHTLVHSLEKRNTLGLTVTASHNPAQYVGVKFVVPVVHAIGYDCGPAGGLARVRELYHSTCHPPTGPRGTLQFVNRQSEYIRYAMQQARVEPGDLRGLTVVLDAFNGSAGPEIYECLTQAGATVHALRIVPDGTFPTGSPNPTSTGKMNAAIDLAKQVGAQLVIGVDGDGDRMVFGDASGILTAGFAFVPILQSCLASTSLKSPVALYDPKVSPLALAEWGKLGAKPVLFRNGHSQIKDYMTKLTAIAAAEESGHYYHRMSLGDLTISGENSCLTILLLARAIVRDAQLMPRLWSMETQIVTTGEFNYQFADDAQRDAALDAVISLFTQDGATTATTTDDGIDLQGTCVARGVTLTPGAAKLASAWYSGYFRVATNEKGVVRSYLSAGDPKVGQTIEQKTRDLLEARFGGKRVE
jgi:phosphomannomutase